MHEIEPKDLALSRGEVRALLRSRGLQVDDSGLDELCQATEGWTAGLRLITLA